MIGCNSNSSPAGSGSAPNSTNQMAHPTDDAHGGSSWSLKLQSKCTADVTDDQCVGAFGFTVFADGRYQDGPAATGAVKNGNITQEELSSLTAALNPVLSIASLGAEGHAALGGDSSQGEDTVTLVRGSSGGDIIIHAASADLTYRTESGDQAKAVLSALKTLAAKYYALPFPDGCSDRAATLTSLYASLQTCSADKDCAYLDSFQEVDPSTYSFITTDDCSVVKPLAVGNLKLITGSWDKIQQTLGLVQEACGARVMRADCTDISGFTLNGAPAACKQGVCQAGGQAQPNTSTH